MTASFALRPAERAPVILETPPDADFALIDSGLGQKLERYGARTLVRPDAQAIWPRALPDDVWASADATFAGEQDDEDSGRWRKTDPSLSDVWPLRFLGVEVLGRLTAFRHVGVFPEQLAHWRWMLERIEALDRPAKVLNLFAYTGVGSVIAAKAGAVVTHVDASKKAIGWAKANQAQAGLDEGSVRWICEDARKFVAREGRRGSAYDLILVDPPKFGRGPNGEVWRLFDDLPQHLADCRAILAPDGIGLVLTAYSIRASFFSIHELLRETMRGAGGLVESGELVIREAEPGARRLSTSLFSRWTPGP